METSTIFFIICVVAFTCAAAAVDYRTRKLPNWLTVSAFALGVVFHLIHGAVTGGWLGMIGTWRTGGLVYSLAGFALGFGVLFVLWLIGGGGGGDVKMMGALGAWLGIVMIFQVLIVGTLFIAIMSMVVFASRIVRHGMWKSLHSATTNSRSRAGARRGKADRMLPFGVPVAAATWVVIAFQFFDGG